jgi:hypothetical protein
LPRAIVAADRFRRAALLDDPIQNAGHALAGKAAIGRVAKGTVKTNAGIAPLLNRFGVSLPSECMTDGTFDLARYLAVERYLTGSPEVRDRTPAAALPSSPSIEAYR